MLRLPAQVNHPYRVSIEAAGDDATLAATVTRPDGTTVDPLTLTADGAVQSASYIPAVVGDYTVAITASDNPDLVGLSFELVVGSSTRGDLVIHHEVTDPACGVEKPVRWPCPHLPGLQCIDEFDPAAVIEWMGIGTQTIFRDTVSRFPGCYWYARLRPRISGSCLCMTPAGRWGFDLFDSIRYPALELLEVEVEGTAVDLTAEAWTIERKRYLVPPDGVNWPTQDWDAPAGDPGTWSVLVRYGRAVPRLVVRARDLMAYALILETEPTTAGEMPCRLPNGTTQLSENGRVITVDVSAAGGVLHKQLIDRWGGSPWKLSQLIDPAEVTSRGSRTALWVPGDQVPLSHSTFLQSGCDLAAELAALAL